MVALRHPTNSLALTVLVPLLSIGLFILLDWLYIQSLSFAEAELETLSNLQEKQIDLFVQQSNLLTTLTGALFAALGALSVKDTHQPLNAPDLSVLMLAATFAGFSLYFGYLAYQEIIWMLGQKFFNLDTPQLAWPRRLQFFTFLGGVFFGLLFVLRRVTPAQPTVSMPFE